MWAALLAVGAFAGEACGGKCQTAAMPCGATNGVCYVTDKDTERCPPGTQNCYCPVPCTQAAKPCLDLGSGVCFDLVGGICPGGTRKCPTPPGPPPGPGPKSECDNICTDEAKPCAHAGVCFPHVGGICPGDTKECYCPVACPAATPCENVKSHACFPFVGAACPAGTKVCSAKGTLVV